MRQQVLVFTITYQVALGSPLNNQINFSADYLVEWPIDLSYSLPANNNINGNSGDLNSGENATTVAETVVIHNATEGANHSFVSPFPFSRALLSSGSDGANHNILSFFERPIIISQGIWSASLAAGNTLVSVNLPDDFLLQPVILQKLKGFLGFRGTACVRLQINPNRFQQGRLMMTYFPQADKNPDRYNTAIADLLFASQLPRVDYDCCTDTEVSMEIPYINQQLFFNTKSGDGQSGTITILIYSPLVAVTSETTVDYTLWISYKDVELVYPTYPAGFAPQSERFVSKKKKKRGAVQDDEISDVSGGPISSILTRVAKSANYLTPIPMISSIAGTVSWAASLGSRIASAFGYSNPLNVNKQLIVQQQPLSRMMNCSGPDNSYNLGLFEDNQIAHLPGFAGTDVDEMSFNHILSIPTYFHTIVWEDTFADDFLLYQVILQPDNFRYNGPAFNVNTLTAVVPTYNTPTAYLASLFWLYRGTIKIKLKFVKTEFHSGRLLIGFVPSYISDGTINNANLDWAHREVVDLRQTSEIEFSFPYASTRPYLNRNQFYGTVNIRVLNDLRHPDTVSPNVTILMEQYCDTDFEFAFPTGINNYPALLGTGTSPPTSLTARIADEAIDLTTPFAPQIGNDQPAQVTSSVGSIIDPAPVGTTKIITDGHQSASACIGEKVVSVRQLMKRATNFFIDAATSKCVSINPWVANCLAPATGPIFGLTWIPDYFTQLSLLYSYGRGSIRFKTASTDGNSNGLGLWQSATVGDLTGNTSVSAVIGPIYALPYVVGNSAVYPMPEVQVPYYSDTHMSIITPSGTGSTYMTNNVPTAKLLVFIPVETGQTLVKRQIGDDFSLGFFIGTMPLVTASQLDPNYNRLPDLVFYP